MYYYLLYIGYFGVEYLGMSMKNFTDIIKNQEIKMPSNILLTASFLRKYPKNKGGYFVPHYDSSGLLTRQRIVAVMIYLNDLQYGGETMFPVLKRRTKPRAGSLVLFPSYITHIHYGNSSPQDKYVLVSHIEDRSAELTNKKEKESKNG